jgi:hypothetical protein
MAIYEVVVDMTGLGMAVQRPDGKATALFFRGNDAYRHHQTTLTVPAAHLPEKPPNAKDSPPAARYSLAPDGSGRFELNIPLDGVELHLGNQTGPLRFIHQGKLNGQPPQLPVWSDLSMAPNPTEFAPGAALKLRPELLTGALPPQLGARLELSAGTLEAAPAESPAFRTLLWRFKDAAGLQIKERYVSQRVRWSYLYKTVDDDHTVSLTGKATTDDAGFSLRLYPDEQSCRIHLSINSLPFWSHREGGQSSQNEKTLEDAGYILSDQVLVDSTVPLLKASSVSALASVHVDPNCPYYMAFLNGDFRLYDPS